MKEQIEEMANDIEKSHWKIVQDFMGCHINSEEMAEHLYNAGYRKQGEPFSRPHENGSEWISVEERLPDKEGKYLVCTTNGNIGVGDFIDYYGKGTHLCFACWTVTHWMPLPEAPKMKGGAE